MLECLSDAKAIERMQTWESVNAEVRLAVRHFSLLQNIGKDDFAFFLLWRKTNQDSLKIQPLWRSTPGTAKSKTYNSWYSLVVTHLTTNQPVYSLSSGERTGSSVLYNLWSYV